MVVLETAVLRTWVSSADIVGDTEVIIGTGFRQRSGPWLEYLGCVVFIQVAGFKCEMWDLEGFISSFGIW